MTPLILKQKVQARDRLVLQAEKAGAHLQDQVLGALARGDLQMAEAAAQRNESQLREITENLRIYQVELHAQADELAASQARTEQVLQRFASLFADMPVAALLVGLNGQVLDHNAAAALLFGMRPLASSARFLHRAVLSDDYQTRVRPAFHEAHANGASVLSDIGFITENGGHFTGELHIARLPVAQGGVVQFTCAVIDRTEHLQDLHSLRAAALALQQSEASLADSARLARTGGWQLQLGSRRLQLSKELRGLLELPADEPTSLEALLSHCAVQDRARLAHAVAQAELGETFEIEIDLQTSSGRALRALAVGHADHVNGEVERVSGVFQDISGPTLARQQIGDLTERLNLANDAGGIGIWDWDIAHASLVFDERMNQLLGVMPLAITPVQHGVSLVDALAAHLHSDDAALLAQAVSRALNERVPLNLEARRSGADGTSQWLHFSGRAHFGLEGRGHAVRLVGCMWDSSRDHEAARLRAARDAAESASRAKSAFLSRMSHELRTPLNAILGFSQLMRMEAEAGDLVLKPHRVTLIETAARHLLALVNEVLDVSRIEAGHVEVNLQACSLSELFAEVLPMLQGLADKAEVTVFDHITALPALQVWADRLRLKEVLINLLSNAIKYNRRGGRVDLRASTQGRHVELQVADTGVGLDAQQRAAMFQPFNRLGAEALGVEGTGMGLFVSRRFAELMQGQISVESEAGQGSCFTLRLLAPPAEVPA